MGKGLERASRHPLRPSGFGEAVPFLDLGGEGSGVGVGVDPCAATRPAPCVPSSLCLPPGSSRGEAGCGAPGCFSRLVLFSPPLFLVSGKVRGWARGGPITSPPARELHSAPNFPPFPALFVPGLSGMGEG